MHTQTIPVIAYYDLIACGYNDHMTGSDREVRGQVRSVFGQYVAQGNVLDFGGGTGLDLPWLTDLGYHVFFLEPSAGMRKLARQEASLLACQKMPVFLEEDTDIGRWSATHLPFIEKMNGVLADFAVLNCFGDLPVFFEKMSLVSKDGSPIIACVLDLPWLGIVKTFGLRAALRKLLKGSITVPNGRGRISHQTYLRSIRRYSRAAHPYFRLIARIPLGTPNFSLFIFRK